MFNNHYFLLCRNILLKFTISAACDMCSVLDLSAADAQWIMKAPFTTNAMHYKSYVNSLTDAMQYIRRVRDDMFGLHPTCYILPYVMLQERVSDNREVKICFVNGRFNHIASVASSVKSIRGYLSSAVVSFATEALRSLKRLDNVFILDGLVRVDVFKSNDGHLVVNDLESLDACYSSLNVLDTSRIDKFLEEYWENKIYECIIKLLSPLK